MRDFKPKDLRKLILEMANRAKCPHIGSALSCADIIWTLYSKILKLKPYDTRDIFILSKAHSAMSLYAMLYTKGLLEEQDFLSYYQNDGVLPAHTDRFSNPYVEISAGSLGHGLPIALGMAKALKAQNRHVFVLMGDGECQEGSVWEAAMLAPKLELDNLCVIIDYNNLQGYGRARELSAYEPVEDKWQAFGWEVRSVNGHDTKGLENALSTEHSKPLCVICSTIKGKGVDFMENELKWHYYIVTDEILEQALKVLK